MRPIPALIALACVAALFLVGLLMWTGAKDDPSALDPVARQAREHATAEQPAVDLAAAPDDKVPDRQAEVAPEAMAPDGRMNPAAQGTARRVSGRVVDMAGQPVANAIVYAAAGGGFDEIALDEIDPNEPWFQRVDTKTDAQGRFALDPKMQSQVRIAVRAPGFAPLDADRTVSATSPDVGDLVLQAGVVLEGRVVDHAGRPVAGAELRRRRANAGGFAMFGGRGGAVVAKTDAAGGFRADTLPAGPWTLRVTSEIAPDKDESGETTRPGEVVRGLSIQLEEGFEIAGVVTGAPAAEVANLHVAANQLARGEAGEFVGIMGAGGQRKGTIAPDGAFVVRGLRKEAKYRLSVRQGGASATQTIGSMMRNPNRSAPVEVTAGERGVELAYRSETALTFQVLDAATGKPVTEMVVAAGSRWPAPLMDAKNRKVRDFPEGRVRYGALRTGGGPMMRPGGNAPPSAFTLQVEAPGYAKYERKDLALVEGSDNDLGVIRLEPTQVVKVEVRAVGTNAPIAGARVSLEEVNERAGGERTSFAISLGGGGDDEPVDFGGGDSHRDVTDAQGRALVSSFPGSRGRLVVKHKDYAESRSDVFDLPLDQDFERAVTLSAGGTVVVNVFDAAGTAVVGQAIEHRRPGVGDVPMMLGGAQLMSDAEGHATQTHLEPGVHGFRLATEGGGLAMLGGGATAVRMVREVGGPDEGPKGEPWTEIEVTEGGAHEVRLVAPERARVFGRVREGGRALAGASVRLKEKGSDDMPFFDQGPKAETDGLGEFALENVPAGDYVMTVAHTGRAMDHEVEVRVRAGENRQDVDLPVSTVEGKVTDSEGKPVAGIRIRVEKVSGGDSTVREFSFAIDSGDGPVSFGGGGGGQVTTNAEGRYKLRGVQPDVDLVVVATGSGVQRTTSDKLRVPVDGTRSNVDLVLQKGATIEVTCRRPDGTPATPCEVRAELQGADDSDSKIEITRGDGKCRFQGLKPGRWRVSARDLTADDENGPAPAEQTLDVVVGPPHQVALEVRGS